MVEIRKYGNATIKIGKEKGVYSGEAIAGLISPTPEGFGEAVFANAGVTLKGRFKGGCFVSGEAVTPFAQFHGNFDNFEWLGGSDGEVKFADGSFIKGEVNPRTKRFEVSELRVMDAEFGDVFKLFHSKDLYGQTRLVGEQKLKNGSKIEGDFAVDKINRDVLVQTEVLPKFACVDGNCDIILQKDEHQTVKISGKYARALGDATAVINGDYALSNTGDGVDLECRGNFEFTRHEDEREAVRFDENFGKIRVRSDLGCAVDLVLRENGRIKLATNGGTFCGYKLVLKNGDGSVVYKGEMSTKNRSTVMTGFFDGGLAMLGGQIELKTKDESATFVFDNVQKKQSATPTDINLHLAQGKYSKKGLCMAGLFDAEVVLENDRANIVKSARLQQVPTHICGEISQSLADGAEFKGELWSEEQRLGARGVPKIVKDLSVKKIYSGTLRKLDKDGARIFEKDGIFSDGYVFERGRICENDALGIGYTFIGDFKRGIGYKGVLQNPENGDYQEGKFDPNMKFLAGKMRQTYPNRAIFEGKTDDMAVARGMLSRTGDFIQVGKFELDDELYPIFVWGDLSVWFADDQHTFCNGKFNRKGIKLSSVSGESLFDGRAYLLNFKNDAHPEGVAVSETDLTDAYGKFLTIARYCLDGAKIEETAQTEVEATAEVGDAVVEEAKTEQKEDASKTGQLTQERYVEIVANAGEAVETETAGDKGVDMLLAQSMISRLVNPNKEPEQDKE